MKKEKATTKTARKSKKAAAKSVQNAQALLLWLNGISLQGGPQREAAISAIESLFEDDANEISFKVVQ